jgi:hypothetical protein
METRQRMLTMTFLGKIVIAIAVVFAIMELRRGGNRNPFNVLFRTNAKPLPPVWN